MSSVWQWLPSAETVRADLGFVPEVTTECTASWKGMDLWNCVTSPLSMAVGNAPRILATNWELPLLAVAAYLVMIPALRHWIAKRGKVDVRGFVFYWNTGLSLFSLAGVLACAPVLLRSLYDHGLYFATCAPAEWYGTGLSGFFVLLFVLSKLAELVDTVLLLLSGKPVILLHWWHHTTVLLYCWHSYSVRISTGIWFAVMNYFVHSIMYGYFAATQTSLRRRVMPFAMYITLLQLVQMLVGIWVTVKAVLYQMDGSECHVNKTNSFLGLAMYVSYFLLFGKLFVEHYVLKGKQAPKARKQPSVIRSVSEHLAKAAAFEGNGSEEASEATAGDKKVN